MATLPKPNGEFEWTQESWGAALRCSALTPFAPHCFAARNLEAPGADRQETGSSTALAFALGLAPSPNAIVRLRQVHGTSVFDATSHQTSEIPEADIAIASD